MVRNGSINWKPQKVTLSFDEIEGKQLDDICKFYSLNRKDALKAMVRKEHLIITRKQQKA